MLKRISAKKKFKFRKYFFLSILTVFYGILLLIFVTDSAAHKNQSLPSLAGLVKKVSPSVVNIKTETLINTRKRTQVPGMPGGPDEFFRRFFDPGFRSPSPRTQPRKRRSAGTGFVIDSSGLILTNYHVIMTGNNKTADKITVKFKEGSKGRKAKLIGKDKETDLALLQIEKKPGEIFQAVKFGNSDSLRVGDWVVAIGNPFGLGHTVTAGIVSGKGRIARGRYLSGTLIQTDASINPGNSGGPLFNLNGEVVGVNQSIYTKSGGNMGIGFAIPINTAEKIIPQIKRGGRVSRGFLGVSIQPITENIGKNLGLKNTSGALVSNLTPDGPAFKAGIKRGDIIIGLNLKTIKKPRDLMLAAADLKPGSRATVHIIRNKRKISVMLIVDQRPNTRQRAKALSKSQVSKKLGIEGQDLNTSLAKKLRTRRKNGVVIIKVLPNSPAAFAGLKRGDIIFEANRIQVKNMIDLQKALKSAESGFLLLLERDGSPFYVGIQ